MRARLGRVMRAGLPCALGLAAAPGAIAALPAAPASGAGACHEDSRVVMGTTATVRVCGAGEQARRGAASAALDEIDRVDRLMSHYRPQSPLSRLNRAAAQGPVVVDAELYAFLELCLRWSRESDGAFDVTVGPLMKAWGFFRDEGRVPGEEQLAAARALVGYRHVVLDPARRSVSFDREGVEIDLGGIGKGYAVDRAVAVLRRLGIRSALVNLGGSSVYGLGAPEAAPGWTIGIEDPTDPSRTALRVTLQDRALSVSGGYAKAFVEGGVTYSHVMDPRTGRPVRGVLCVAVLSASATDGDALDNAVAVLGLARARALVASLPEASLVEVLFFAADAASGFRLERLAR